MRVVFFISAGFVIYTYLVYPLVIALLGSLFRRRVRKRYARVPISVILAVRDEEADIEERLRNLLEQDYPSDLVEIVVVSDGSKDRTVQLAREIGDPQINVVELPVPLGRAAAINLAVEKASNDIIVFADARQRFGENVFAELTAMLQDDSVGAASGELVIRQGASDLWNGVAYFRRYEKFIRLKESETYATVGATGSIYAIRKRLFQPLPPETMLDDFLVPMRIILQGFRVVFVRSARAFDWTGEQASREFARTVRRCAGSFQALAIDRSLLNPVRNPAFFQMFSHRVTRLVVPYFMAIALVSNLFLTEPFFRVTLVLQLLFYVALLLRFTPLVAAPVGGVIRAAWMFAAMNAAAVMGLWVYLRGKEELS